MSVTIAQEDAYWVFFAAITGELETMTAMRKFTDLPSVMSYALARIQFWAGKGHDIEMSVQPAAPTTNK